MNLGESLELQAPTQTRPREVVRSRRLAVAGAVEAPGAVFEIVEAAVEPLLDDEGCLVRVRVEHGYEGSKGRCRVEVTNVSDSVY